MPEASVDATLLIATSWQALKRVRAGDQRTEICNCSIVIVFAAFFIEANLNHIIHSMNADAAMRRFLGLRHPGLQDKLAWLYNEHVARAKARTRPELYDGGIEQKLQRKFPGFLRIYRFRNDVSHGTIDTSAAKPENAERLRLQAKAIVDELFEVARKAGYPLVRSIPYEVAITSRVTGARRNRRQLT